MFALSDQEVFTACCWSRMLHVYYIKAADVRTELQVQTSLWFHGPGLVFQCDRGLTKQSDEQISLL